MRILLVIIRARAAGAVLVFPRTCLFDARAALALAQLLLTLAGRPYVAELPLPSYASLARVVIYLPNSTRNI